jgi:hypothetical protein
MADNTIKIFTIKVDTQSGEVKINGITKSFKEAEIALKDLNQQSVKTTKTGLNPLTGATGLAGAAVTELGRTISDVNYGFPAVANNISQLGSLLTILTTKAGGAKGAFELMLKQLRGPLGILLAFQVGITLIEAISKGFIKLGKDTDTLTKAFKDAGKGVADISGNFETYINTLQDSNKSQEEQEEAVKRLNKEFPDFVQNLKESDLSMQDIKNSTKEANEQIDLQRLAIINLAKSRAAQKRIEELSAEIIDKQVEQQKETIALGVEGLEVEELRRQSANISIDEFSEVADSERINRLNALADLKEENKVFIENKRQEIKLLSDYIEFEEEGRGKSTKSKRAFVARELSFNEEILKSQDKVNKKITKSQFVRLEQEEELQKKLARIKFDEYKERELARANAIKDPKDRKKAIEKANEAIGRSLASLSQYEIQLTKETQDKKTQIIADAIVKQFDLATQLNAKEREAVLGFEASMATNELDKIEVERKLEDEKLNNKLNALDIEKQKRIENGEFYGDILIKEEQAVNASERQKTKFKEKEEKTKLAIANQVSQAIIGIAGEGSAVGKAVAVAMAIMNTKEAITAALGAKPYGPWNIAQAVATGVFGMQQVREIMSTKLPEAAGGSGGGAGASMSVSAPDFNVVGQGAGSQVAQAVTSAQDRPFRAYVVSGDVTSAQELDRKTVTESAIG